MLEPTAADVAAADADLVSFGRLLGLIGRALEDGHIEQAAELARMASNLLKAPMLDGRGSSTRTSCMPGHMFRLSQRLADYARERALVVRPPP